MLRCTTHTLWRKVPRFTVAAPLALGGLPSRSLSSSSLDRFLPRQQGGSAPSFSPSAPQRLPRSLFIGVVPQQSAWVVERLGKFHKVLDPGLQILIPVLDKVTYVHSLKEEAINVPNQTAITSDNVTIAIDGVLYIKIVDPVLASYGIADVKYAMTQLAQTTMRSELGKISLDETFANRETLNEKIVRSINKATEAWGVECLRYEIKDILPPESVKHSMDRQAEAERRKRASILDSEGEREAAINVATGARQALIMKAEGEAAATLALANASAQAIEVVSKAVNREGGKEAVALSVAEKYVDAFGNIAKEGTTVLLPADVGSPSSMIAQALSIFQATQQKQAAPSNTTATEANIPSWSVDRHLEGVEKSNN